MKLRDVTSQTIPMNITKEKRDVQKKWDMFLPVASPAPVAPTFHFIDIFTLDLTDRTKITGENHNISDFHATQNEALSALTGIVSRLGISIANDPTIDEVFSQLYAQHDTLLTQKFEKNEIYRKLFDPDYIDQRSEADTNPDHIESVLLRKLAREYRKYIEMLSLIHI